MSVSANDFGLSGFNSMDATRKASFKQWVTNNVAGGFGVWEGYTKGRFANYDEGMKASNALVSFSKANPKKTEADIAKEKLESDNKDLSGKLENIENFSTNYEKENPYKLDANSPQMQAWRRIAQGAKAATGATIGKALAQRGVSDSGQSTRNIARMNQQFATGEQGAMASEDLRQKSEYLGRKENVFKEKMTGYQFGNAASQQAYDNAMTNYWQNLALQQQQAAMEWQKKETEEQQTWDRFFGIAGLGLDIFKGLS